MFLEKQNIELVSLTSDWAIVTHWAIVTLLWRLASSLSSGTRGYRDRTDRLQFTRIIAAVRSTTWEARRAGLDLAFPMSLAAQYSFRSQTRGILGFGYICLSPAHPGLQFPQH